MCRRLTTLVAESTAFFAGLDAPAPRLIAGCASNVTFDARASTCSARATRRQVLPDPRRQRRARDLRPGAGAVVIETLDAGDVLGWSWLFPPYRWHFDAVCSTQVHGDRLRRRCLRGKCDADHALGYELLRHFATGACSSGSRPPGCSSWTSTERRWRLSAAGRCAAAAPVPRPAARCAGDARHLDARAGAARARARVRRRASSRCCTRSASARCRSRSAATPSRAPLVQTIRAVGAVTEALARREPGACSASAARSAPAGRSSEATGGDVCRRRRHRPGAAAPGRLRRARRPRALRPGDPPLRRPHARRHRLSARSSSAGGRD